MFDFDIGKLMVVGIVALAVIPPKDLPRVMRTVGQVVGKMRRMAAEFQGQFMDAMREADLESVRKELEALNEKVKIEASFDPAGMIRDEVTKAAAPLDAPAADAALPPSKPALPAPDGASDIAAEMENVRKELEALSGKTVRAEADAPREAAAEVALDAPPAPEPHDTPHGIEAPARQSAAE